jgi:hypothetical protein
LPGIKPFRRDVIDDVVPHLVIDWFIPQESDDATRSGTFYATPVPPWEDGTWDDWN